MVGKKDVNVIAIISGISVGDDWDEKYKISWYSVVHKQMKWFEIGDYWLKFYY